MKILRLEEDNNIEENIIKDIKIFLEWKKLKEEKNDATIKCIRNIFRLKRENKAIKCRILTDTRNLFELEEEDYYRPARVNNISSSSYTEYKSKGNTRTLSV